VRQASTTKSVAASPFFSQLPDGWSTRPLKHFGRLRGGSGFPDEYQGIHSAEIPFFKVKALERSDKTLLSEHADDTISSDIAAHLHASVFPKNSLVFAKVGAALMLARYRFLGQPSCIDNNMMAFELQDGNLKPSFAWYVLDLLDLSYIVNPGAVPSISASQIGSQLIPVPPSKQQDAIADFLDHETAEADALVAKYERLLELLEEKRIALITHAITKGINPNEARRSSGIEWLGEMPSHWRILRNKTLFKERDERSEDGSEELLSVSHLTGVTPRSEKNVNMFLAESNVGYKRCFKGDLAINTMWAWMGALGVSRHDGIVSPSYNVYEIRDKRQLDPDFYDFLSRSLPHVAWIGSVSTGVWESRLRLYADRFLDIWTCIPPLAEQKATVAFLKERLSVHSRISESIRQALALVQERRSALIMAAVTGQIDVKTYRPQKQQVEVPA
jgi:type I restriction enzyme S subunit